MRAQRQADTNIAAIIALLVKIKTMLSVIRPAAPPAAISAEEQLARMQCNIRGSLFTLLRKEKQDDVLSRTEWHFLANMSYNTYDSAYHNLEIIDRDLIAANMLAFAAAMRLRDEQYPQMANQDADQYYRGNMGFSWIDRNAADLDLQAFVRAGVEGLPRFPSAGVSGKPTALLT